MVEQDRMQVRAFARINRFMVPPVGYVKGVYAKDFTSLGKFDAKDG